MSKHKFTIGQLVSRPANQWGGKEWRGRIVKLVNHDYRKNQGIGYLVELDPPIPFWDNPVRLSEWELVAI